MYQSVVKAYLQPEHSPHAYRVYPYNQIGPPWVRDKIIPTGFSVSHSLRKDHLNLPSSYRKSEVKAVLECLDSNKDGKISVEELKSFLDSANCNLKREDVEAFIKTHDADKDGKLDLDELVACLSLCGLHRCHGIFSIPKVDSKNLALKKDNAGSLYATLGASVRVQS
ncbi:hypothetical protein CSKR_107176 [Clonorchis sinensis]|uniref:Calcium-binding protein n=2 Tax=Clonorchis sinensis TaxID=79923 RepID=G7YNX6_CLOSI|nr:hypothetical protein CSKR_107176 [Clonorchis sinensis]GAA54657.1 calcium-binding protein [Clonorchis sinensis]